MNDLDELKGELTAPIKSFRLFAIEKAMRMEASQQLLTCLEECLSKELDTECLILLKHSLQLIKEKLSGGKAKDVTLNEIEQFFPGSTPERQLSLLGLVKVSSIKNSNYEVIVPGLLEAAANDVVSAEIVKKFRRFWPESQKKFLENNVYSKSRLMQIASIETLMKIYPETIKSHLPKLVNINDPVIRSLAIWSMSRFFPELAADFIGDCLEQGDYYNKATALQISSTMDFALIKNSLLNLVFAENDSRIFKAACLIILNNPDKEIPFRLMDMITKSPKEKARYLNEFLPKYCENLKVSGICENFSSYMQTLSTYAGTLKARIFVHNCLNQLSTGSENDIQETSAELKAAIAKDPQISEIVLNQCKSRSDNSLKTIIEKIIGTQEKSIETPAADLKASQEKTDTRAEELLETKLNKEFARARFSKSPETAKKAVEVLHNANSSHNLRLAAFKAATHLEIEGLLAVAKEFLESEEEFKVSAALQYLEKFNKDAFHIATQKLIHTDSIIVRNALINATCRSNPGYARFLTKSLLKSRERGKRLSALESTVQLDFSFIFDDLVNFLEKEEDVELINSCLSIFMANPRIDAIYQLRQIKGKRSTFQEMFEKAEKEMTSITLAAGIADQIEIDNFINRKEQEKQARSKNENQTKELLKAKKNLVWSSSATNLSFLSQHGAKISAVIVILLLTSFTYSFLQDSQLKISPKVPASSTPVRVSRTRSKAMKALPADGTVETFELLSFDKANRTWKIKNDKDEIFRVFLKDPDNFKAGNKVKIKIQAARYSLTGQVVIFVESAELIN